MCLDEMGPVSAKTYAAHRWTEPPGPRLAPDYGGRGSVWVFGALEPQTGEVLTTSTLKRNSPAFVQFLEQVVATWPQGDLVLILDNLSIHKTLDVRLWALAYPRVRFLFQPTYTPWLNLIEPWWKTLRHLALVGRRFETTLEVQQAIAEATAYWNHIRHPYRWRKAA